MIFYHMKRLLLTILALAACAQVFSQKSSKMEPWQDPNVFEENRMPMRATFVTDQQKTLSLNGVWKFNWNETSKDGLKVSRLLVSTILHGDRCLYRACGNLMATVTLSMSTSAMHGGAIMRIILPILPLNVIM